MVFLYGFMRKQSTGTSCTEPLDATLTPECPRAERMSSALANHANSLGGLCESGGCAERVAVPQPAAQRWTVLLWPLPVKLEVKLFHGWNEWLRRYFSSSEMHQSLGATKTEQVRIFAYCSADIDRHCAGVRQKAATSSPQLCCIPSVCVRALINNRQQDETGVCHSVLQRRDRS